MQTIGDLLSTKFSTSPQEKKKSNISTPAQAQVLYYAGKLGVEKKDHKTYGHLNRLQKNWPGLTAKAFSFAIDYPNCRQPIRIFFWKFYELYREQKAKVA